MLKLYNTLTRKKEVFRPISPPKVGMYVCGPTIYGPSHLGHARTYIAFDVIRRYLEYQGFKVKYVVNITDVHDDMIKEAKKRGITIFELADKFLPVYFQDMESLNVKPADACPRVTEYIKEIIKMVKILIDKGYGYVAPDGSVYYDVSQFKNYGRLSRIKLEETKTGTRVETDKYEKKEPADFALWKAHKKGEPFWDSPWGKGRPGWHIECSVMSQKYLRETIDIHGGARDLIFPHHENEIAQSEAATGKRFVKYWLHGGLLKINGQKMAKSLGNYIEIPNLLKTYEPMVVRLYLISGHYRSAFDYTKRGIASAKSRLERWREAIKRMEEKKKGRGKEAPEYKREFIKVMDDDFNTPRALALVDRLVSEANKTENREQIANIEYQILDFDRVLGLRLATQIKTKIKIPQEIKKLVEKREKLRKEKRWQETDEIRKKILKMGYQIEDTKQGPKLKKLWKSGLDLKLKG